MTAAGRRAIVVSAGGSMVREIERAGGQHFTLPVDSKNPMTMRKNIAALTELSVPKYWRRACPKPRAGMERARSGGTGEYPLHDDVSRHL